MACWRRRMAGVMVAWRRGMTAALGAYRAHGAYQQTTRCAYNSSSLKHQYHNNQAYRVASSAAMAAAISSSDMVM